MLCSFLSDHENAQDTRAQCVPETRGELSPKQDEGNEHLSVPLVVFHAGHLQGGVTV